MKQNADYLKSTNISSQPHIIDDMYKGTLKNVKVIKHDILTLNSIH